MALRVGVGVGVVVRVRVRVRVRVPLHQPAVALCVVVDRKGVGDRNTALAPDLVRSWDRVRVRAKEFAIAMPRWRRTCDTPACGAPMGGESVALHLLRSPPAPDWRAESCETPERGSSRSRAALRAAAP
eukprot:scaffold118856_cov69-Phaeocystis_antarctica.AAC.4